jgi:hypothetical protein
MSKIVNVSFREAPPLTDAQWIGQLVPQALEQHRYTLATELIRLAGRAAAYDRARADAAALVPVEHSQAQTEMFGTAPTRNVPVVRPPGPGYGSRAPQHCHFVPQLHVGTLAEPEATVAGQKCGQPIGWTDGGTSSREGWYHLERGLDDDHLPVPGQG